MSDEPRWVLRCHEEACMSAAMAAGRSAAHKQKIDEWMDAFASYGCRGG